MNNSVCEKLIILCNTVPAKLKLIPEQEICFKPSANKWSKKEILGHLVDSATNNHQRFVRSQFEVPVIYYEQDLWVSLQNYQNEDTELLINLWQVYNRHLAYIIGQISSDKLSRTSIGRDGKTYSLSFIIEDYLGHLDYHLNQIVS